MMVGIRGYLLSHSTEAAGRWCGAHGGFVDGQAGERQGGAAIRALDRENSEQGSPKQGEAASDISLGGSVVTSFLCRQTTT